ncbi:hypothetical protein [Frateuria defendens]|uniref:hypothetical protein n=1 Tax=Frateuria defendens TaxID=2219559 RepID=UPI0007DC302A|nr:hypothetical protein [Frateuria defendens]
MTDPIATLIARLLAERWLPREDEAVRRVLIDAELRDDLDRRLAAAGLRLLEHPYAAHVAVGVARAQENEVFGGARAWAASNLQLDRDALALLVVLWALLVLPKRQRQIARQEREKAQAQSQMFAEAKPVPVGAEVVEPINERTLLADFGDKLGGKTRIHLNLGLLARQGFIQRRKERIQEGPLLDLAFDYERIASRIMDGALAFVVAEARANPPMVAGPDDAHGDAVGEADLPAPHAAEASPAHAVRDDEAADPGFPEEHDLDDAPTRDADEEHPEHV